MNELKFDTSGFPRLYRNEGAKSVGAIKHTRMAMDAMACNVKRGSESEPEVAGGWSVVEVGMVQWQVGLLNVVEC